MGKDSAFLANKKLHPVSIAKNYVENDINTISCVRYQPMTYIFTAALMAKTSLLPFLSDNAE
jgi:hypothetical protein